MAKFKLELQLKKDSWMLLTDFDSSKPSKTITFNEQLQEGENDSYSLSLTCLNLSKTDKFTGSLIAVGRVLRLTYSKPERKVGLWLKTLVLGRDNLFTASAQDYGYVFARNNVGLTLDTIDDEDFGNGLKSAFFNQGITTITNVGNYILEVDENTQTNLHTMKGGVVKALDKSYDNLGQKFSNTIFQCPIVILCIELANTSDTFYE